MKTKKLCVFFLAIVSVLFSATLASATPLAEIYSVDVEGVYALHDEASIIAGETISVEIYFQALENASDVRVEATLEGEKIDVSEKSSRFDVEANYMYKKSLTLKVPYELRDELKDVYTLTVKIWNGDYKSEKEMKILVQRKSYEADVMSISVDKEIEAGEVMAIDVAVRNIGYNKLDDLYVTISIPKLGIEKEAYFDDVVPRDCYDEEGYCDENDDDVIKNRFYLKIPNSASEGSYELVVNVENSDLNKIESTTFNIKNDFSSGSNIIASEQTKNFVAGSDVEYSLVILNPTNSLKVYKIIVESLGDMDVVANQNIVAVPAGSSKTIKIKASAESEGIYNFNVNVFSGEKLVGTTAFSAKVTENSILAGKDTSVIVLTIILAVIFLVLLIVLIVLLGKKPENQEEIGESYY